MSQKTNLNIDPYYDDFNQNDNYHRVLFKPGFPVQSRELTSLQSILQNQIESFGSHIFKDGSVVIPGNVTYNSSYYAVKINPTHLGLSVGLYLTSLIGKKIKGQTSQLSAVIQNVVTNVQSETDDYTLYVKYTSADSSFVTSQFSDGETLLLEEPLTYGNTTISTGDTFSTLISLNATSTASSVSLSQGIYFIRGHFVTVTDDTLILDQYTNTPSYRVGLSITESLVDAQEDNSLYDNARGFSNFAAPGADRLKISAVLSKKKLTDSDDKNFVEILRLSNGVLKKIQDTDDYSLLEEYFAKRTYEESGNYAVDQFDVETSDSLNDRINSNGIFYSTQLTDQGNVPSEDLLAVKISPGSAYVKGFNVEKSVTTILDVNKPRDTKKVDSTPIPFEMGNLIKVDNVSGTPSGGVNNNDVIYLNNQRKASATPDIGVGTTIGRARVYSFGLSDAPYLDGSTNWDLYLWDVQTYTKLVVNANTVLTKDAHIKGLSSGASGYTIHTNSNKTFTLYQTSGSFQVGEQISINGTTEVSRTIESINEYTTEDIKSVFQDAGALGVSGLTKSFTADSVLIPKTPKGFSLNDTIQINNAGIATVTGRNFTGIRNDAILRYTPAGDGIPTYNKVDTISSDGLTATLTAVTGVDNHFNGALPTAGNDYKGTFKIVYPKFLNEDKASLYAKLEKDNISNVDLSGSNLNSWVQASKSPQHTTDAGGNLSISISDITGISSAYFDSYSAEKYSVHYESGSVEPLNSGQVTFENNLNTLKISGLTASSNVRVNTTLKKNGATNKKKNYTRSTKKEINLTNSGISSAISGMSVNGFYGLRVEDEEISLNVPDVVKVVAVYEALDATSVTLDKLSFTSGLNLDTQSVLGEKIIGASTGAVGQIVTRSSSTEVEFVYLNSNKFAVNETVRFEESSIKGAISVITKGNYTDKTYEYSLDKGQREQYYDYSRIVRKPGASVPSRRLLVIHNHYTVPNNDTGDVYTVDSYDNERYKDDLPVLKGGRASDVLDFRPRVADFNSTTSSPFAFDNRNFSTAGINPTLVIAPNVNSFVGYSYYLPRIDKLTLNSAGDLKVIQGVSALNPKSPSSIQDGMDIATIKLPAYLYNPSDVQLSLIDNKRYTMRDLRKLEDRLENVEKLTSLTVLELDTKSLQIQDSDGLSRFKSGFFVDNFKDTNFIDIENPDAKVSVDTQNQEVRSDLSLYSLKSRVALNQSIDSDSADFAVDQSLLDTNVKKTGDLVTLNYSEVEWTNLSQNFATKQQDVNPFGVANYNGSLKLTPSSDTWARTLNPESGVVLRSQSKWENSYISNLVSSSSPNNKMRSRNVEFRASGLQPATNYYSFLGGNANIDIVPKLLQITMSSGLFQAGETISGYVDGKKVSSFRVANSNHKTGGYNNPVTTYAENPYSSSLTISAYSSSASIVNIDTYSLADDTDGRFYGHAPAGMFLVGETSLAQATVSGQSLTTDSVGDLIGCFFIRDPLVNPAPPVVLNNVSTTFKVSSSSTNSSATTVTFTESTYHSSGIVDPSVYSETLAVRRPSSLLPLNALRRDPLSQTFRTDNDGGFLTGIDLYFSGKDTTEKLFVEIKETRIGGKPKDKLVQDFARVDILPVGITTSSDGSTATNIKFPSPIYLEPNKQYSLGLVSPASDQYKIWSAEANQATVTTQSYPNAEQVIYSNQYVGGHLYKPQNGSVLTASKNEDLKFKFYKANFTSTSGTAYFHNPTLSIGSTYTTRDANVPTLVNNPIKVLPRKLVVGIVTSSASSNLANILTVGTKVLEGNAYGYIENIGGNVGVVTQTNTGIGYSNGVFSNVPFYTITGRGSGAVGIVTIANNKIFSVSIANTGTGYVAGDVLGIQTSTVSRGSGAKITVSSVPNVDTLYLNNVKGEWFTKGATLSYYNGTTNVSLAGTDVDINSSTPDTLYTGNVIEVSHYNHGMQADTNKVDISGVFPNTDVTAIEANVVGSSLDIAVGAANTSKYDFFEGVIVSATNPGYVLINNEIIKYTSVTTTTIAGISGNRGIDKSITRNHYIGDKLHKYELNGVSLTRINNSHNLPNDTLLNSSREIDKYHIQIDRTASTNASNKSSGDWMVNFVDERSLGGTECIATQNIQFNEINPQFNVLVPDKTNVTSTLRTVSGTSVDGTEASFVDKGFESVSLNDFNQFDSPRIVCSRVNETNNLSSLPRSKSLTLGIRMETENNNLSPVIDLTEASTFIFGRNRINKPISSYVNDSRSNQISDDPHASVYISKRIDLVQPASSLKVFFNAYRHSSNDFRVMYKLFKSDSSEITQSYQYFPGYGNLKDTDGDGFGDSIIDKYLNDGQPDSAVRSSNENEFLDYQYSIDDLDQFSGFVIKIVMNGTNEAFTPKLRDLRVVALA